MSTHRAHCLVLHDRCSPDAKRHIHRWVPTCSCGKWWGIAARSIDKAARQYRNHALNAGREVTTGPVPAPVTPDHLLPAALRRVA